MKSFLVIILLASSLLAQNQIFEQDSIQYHFSPITVTGQRFDMPRKDVAASISIVSPITIGQTNIRSVADAISYLVPGVFTTRRAAVGYGVASLAAGGINIRGTGGKPNTQVLILIDGRPDFQGIFGHPINDAYSLDNVDHIEVLRGPASAVYGTNAMGGVVNIITKELPKTGFRTNLSLEYGSFNTQQYLVQHSAGLGKFQYFTSAGFTKSDGHREKNNFEGQNYSLKLAYQINSNFKLTFNGTATPYEFNDPGPEGIQLAGYFENGDITRYSTDLTLTNDFGKINGSLKIHGNFGEHKLSDGWYSKDQTKGILIFQNFDLPLGIKTTLGFDLKRYGGEAKSSGTDLGSFFIDETAVYLHLQKFLLSQLILSGGIRLEDNEKFGQESIPKLGLIYHPLSQTSLRFSVSKGFRSPTIKDLFLYAPANTQLEPERLINYEIGLNQTFGSRLSFDLVGFSYKGDQLIQTSMIAPGQFKNMNVGENKVQGAEFSLQVEPVENLQTQFSYSYLDSEEKLPYSPNKFNFMINYEIYRLSISLYGETISNLYSSYEPNTFPRKTYIEKMKNYTLVNFKVQYPINKLVQISLGGENIFNESYQILKAYPMPGRTIFTKVAFAF